MALRTAAFKKVRTETIGLGPRGIAGQARLHRELERRNLWARRPSPRAELAIIKPHTIGHNRGRKDRWVNQSVGLSQLGLFLEKGEGGDLSGGGVDIGDEKF